MSVQLDKTQVDPEVLLEKIRASFPDLQWKTHKFIHQGFDHDVIILDGKIVFRFPRSAEYLERLPREIEALTKLHPLIEATIPRYTFIPSDSTFAGYSIIAGTALSTDYFASLPRRAQSAIADQLGVFLTVLHGTKRSEFSFLSEQTDLVIRQEQLKREADQYQLNEKLTTEEFTRFEEILEQVDVLLTTELPPGLIHYDITPRHLLWDEPKQQLGVIDFSDMSFGDPAFDFAELFKYGSEFVDQVFAAYKTHVSDHGFLRRAQIYQRRVGVAVMVTSLVNPEKVSFAKAKAIFDAIESNLPQIN